MKALKQELKIALEGVHIRTFAKGTPVSDLPDQAVAHAEKFNMLEDVKGMKSQQGGDDDKSQSGGDEDKSGKSGKKGGK